MIDVAISVVLVCLFTEVGLAGCYVMYRRGYYQIATLYLLVILAAFGFGLLTNATRLAILAR